MWRGGIAAVLCVLAATSIALAAPGYGITPADPVDVPERTVDLQDNTYTVDTTVRVQPNGTATVDVTAPDEVYRLYLYNSDEQIVVSKRGEGNGTFIITLDGFSPGSYLVSAYARDSGKHEAIEPLVISEYALAVDSPDSVAAGDVLTATVDVTPVAASGNPALVSVVLANDTATTTADATRDGDTYVTRIDTDSLTPGDYRVYALAHSDEEAFGRRELVGLSDPQVVTVGSPDAEDPTSVWTDTITTANSEADTQPATSDSRRTDTRTATPSGTADNRVLAPNATSASTQAPGTAGPVFALFGAVLAVLFALCAAKVRYSA